MRSTVVVALARLAALLAAAPAALSGQETAAPAPAPVAFRHPDLETSGSPRRLAELPPELAASLRPALATLGASPDNALFDPLGGRWSSLVVSRPLVPGSGKGNRLGRTSPSPSPRDAEAWKRLAWSALRDYLREFREELRVDVEELEASPRIEVFDGGTLIQIHARRVLGGVPVRDGGLTAVLNHGNLILFGLEKWGDAPIEPAALDAEAARGAFLRAVPGASRAGTAAPRLELVAAQAPGPRGPRYQYRPVWVFRARGTGSETWEGLVDARAGELLALEDANLYATRKIFGGVYPVANDGSGPEGTEQPGFPMPYADVLLPDATTVYANANGTLGCFDGSIATSLQGLFVRLLDDCGAVNEVSAGDIDLATSGGTNCTTPSLHSAGDTHAARTAYYEVNRLIEQTKGYVPSNAWLQQALTVRVNRVGTCNAFWDGAALNFFSDGAQCRNTGEIASILDHEWAHGLDNNAGNTSTSSPAEAFAAIVPILRLHESCVGRGFFKSGDCDGFGDACTSCTGIADADFAKHASGIPHGIAWADANCPPATSPGPCGNENQCEGQIVMEAAWDLATRDLPASSFDANTAFETATRLFQIGGLAVSSWYQCTAGTAGCPATGGYLNVLAVDDDNGNLTDGTPHMTAIFSAFNRHGLACSSPSPANAGCAGGPTTAPALTVVAADSGARLTWTAVANATKYAVYRTEGVKGCAFGKVKIGETTGTAFSDSGLVNGQTYFYAVLPIGSSAACFGPMSACEAIAPAPGPNLAVFEGSSVHVLTGDGDDFLDNCEIADVSFDVENDGAEALTNVRVLSATSPSHPATTILGTFPSSLAATLAACEHATGTVRLIAHGLAFGDTLEITVEVTADEISPETRIETLSIPFAETDLAAIASRTYSFETPGDPEGWQTVRGTWTHGIAGGGANGSTRYLASSMSIDNACDVIRSPLVRLTGSSTLGLSTNFAIEPFVPDPYDRANVAVFDAASGARTTISPSSGRLYVLPPGAPNGACVLAGQAGWAGTQSTWASSVWSTAALNPGAAFAGASVRIEVAYATDGSLALSGFRFDEVTLTNFLEHVADTQSDACPSATVEPFALAADAGGNGVFEPGETAAISPAWRNAGSAPLAFDGTASGFDGPAGPTYTITDASAQYGTVAVGNAGDCAATGDCFGLRIDAASRPAAHWDASFAETVSPSGDAKTWTLHVGDSFTDVPRSELFYKKIETIFHNGITVGCTAAAYCPSDKVPRSQMAIFIARGIAKGSPLPTSGTALGNPYDCVAGGTSIFADVLPTDIFCKAVHFIAAQNVTGGCDATHYCPTPSVTRAEMAIFMAKAVVAPAGGAAVPLTYGPDPVTGFSYSCDAGSPNLHFADVAASDSFCKHVHFLWAKGAISGCSATQYCPAGLVGRDEMAKFLGNAFALPLYGP